MRLYQNYTTCMYLPPPNCLIMNLHYFVMSEKMNKEKKNANDPQEVCELGNWI